MRLILEPFLWSNVIFKICFSCISKVMIEVGRNFVECLPPDCNTAECFSLFMMSSFYKARADTLPRGSQTMEIVGMSIVTFETEVANFENDIVSEKRPQNWNAFIKIDDLGVILLEKELFHSVPCCLKIIVIVGVAFFPLGHPVLYFIPHINLRPLSPPPPFVLCTTGTT